jgi:hypothetical protein
MLLLQRNVGGDGVIEVARMHKSFAQVELFLAIISEPLVIMVDLYIFIME